METGGTSRGRGAPYPWLIDRDYCLRTDHVACARERGQNSALTGLEKSQFGKVKVGLHCEQGQKQPRREEGVALAGLVGGRFWPVQVDADSEIK